MIKYTYTDLIIIHSFIANIYECGEHPVSGLFDENMCPSPNWKSDNVIKRQGFIKASS
jgi:hypothetical protein